MIFLRTILSGSTLLREPTAATRGVSPCPLFKTTTGKGGKQIGAYTEAIEKRPGCKNLSILCLVEFISSEENTGLQKNNAENFTYKNDVNYKY